MCYSAQIWSDYRKYIREFRAKVGIKEFRNLFFRKAQGAQLLWPKGMEMVFADPQTDEEREIWELIQECRRNDALVFEKGLFEQRKRVVDAQRKIDAKPNKPNKGAHEDVRIGNNKVSWNLTKLADINRTEPKEADSRIFPDWYVPVMTMLDGELVVRPMRYHCRPARATPKYDEEYPDTFNARRTSLEKFWRGEWGQTHGVIMTDWFYEHVDLHKAEGRELRPGEAPTDTIITFRPDYGRPMMVACLWSHWRARNETEEDLLSVAFITDDPPPEVAAAGHDRCVIPLRHENLMAWLNPDVNDLDAQQAILDDRERPYYRHYLEAA
ncbi:putative SOS response-associated peptidase YedK [Pelomonas saccharophila]|uniref:Abasic site processing protein n=1 Tax=Roseateles saccharophilus TaxID=304 RepID=A0ABU1YMM6_ROSSA|nr:SOS response-associated peptidase family protein [Roseateles saccharophilus]MDR7270109.1 putative SOS response-associated peptidase YedK [Roseateles saccharophilus]